MALNVGELYAELRIDADQFTQGLQQGQQALGSLSDAARRAAQEAARSSDAQVQAYGRLRQAAATAAQAVQRAHDDAATAAEQVRVAEERLIRTRQQGGDVDAAERRLVQARRDAETAADRAAQAVDRMEAANRRAGAAARGIDFERVEREARDAADAAARLQREADQAAQATNRIGIPGSLRGAIEGAGGALGQLGERAASVGSSAGGQLGGGLLEGVTGAVGSLGGKAGPIGMALAGIAAVGLGAGAVLAGAIADGMQQEKDLALIQSQLGVGDVAMRTIGQAAAQSYKAGWGESTADVANGIRDAIEAGLLTGEELAPDMTAVSNQLQTVAAVMEEDVSAAARAAGQAVKTGMVDTPEQALDLLVKAQQAGLNVADDMLDTTTEYGTQFRQVGLSGVEAFALMSQAVKNGARDADTAADAIKEFAIRSIDGSEASAAAYDALNLNAEEYTKRIAAGGTDARDAMAEVMRAMNGLDSEVDKNAVAVGLFGTKAEDLGQAMYSMNLDTAVQQFGEVEGAAARAGDTIQNTTAGKIEQAKRSIEVSMNGVKGSLAEAFGPTLEKVAAWVENNQPQIIGFFGDLADAAFATLDGIAAFVSGALDYFATMSELSAGMFGGMLDNLGTLAGGIGSVVKHIPGMEGTGEALEKVGGAMQGYRETMTGAAENMRNWSDQIDNRVRPGLAGMRDLVAQNTDAAKNSALMFQALGDDVRAVPTEHGIQIFENTPEIEANLAALGLSVRELPDGGFEVYADTTAGQTIIDDFVRKNDGNALDMYVDVTTRRRELTGSDNFVGPVYDPELGYALADGAVMVRSYANGGIDRLPDQAVIQAPKGRGLIQWAEDETQGEAFIPLAPSKRGRSLRILAETAARMGMAVVDPTGLGALLGAGDYTGRIKRTFGIEEDDARIAAVLGLRDLLTKGDYTGNLYDGLGWDEDSPEVDALLGLRDRDGEAIARSAGNMARRHVAGEHRAVFHGDPDSLDDRSDPLGWRRFLGGDYTGAMGRWAGEEDSPLVDALFGTRAMLADGDYDGSLAKYGVQEDHPLVGLMLDAHKVFAGKFADGGILGGTPVDGLVALAREHAPDLEATSTHRPGEDNHHGAGKAVDFSNGSGNTDEMLDWANHLADNYGPHLRELIYDDPRFDKNIKDGKVVPRSFYAGAGDHTHHVHAASDVDLRTVEPVTASNSAQLADLETQLADARADETHATTDADRKAAAAKVADLERQIAAIKSTGKDTEKGHGQAVYVTNWPSSFTAGSSTSTSKPSTGSSTTAGSAPAAENEAPTEHDISTPAGRASLAQAIGAKFFANGGFGGVGENHNAHIAPAGSWRVFAEPETGGEAYIPLSPAKRNTSLAVWAQTGQRLGAFAIGAGLAAASGFDTDGNFVGFDTGNNSPAVWQGALDRAIEYLREIAEAEKKPVVHIEQAQINDPQEFVKDSATNDVGALLGLIQKGL